MGPFLSGIREALRRFPAQSAFVGKLAAASYCLRLEVNAASPKEKRNV